MCLQTLVTGLPDLEPAVAQTCLPAPRFPFPDFGHAVSPRAVYLEAAEAIIDQAVAWVDERGIVVDPVEGHDDRWQGGTAARFICPAAILISELGRTDLLPAVSRCFDQLVNGILRCAAGSSEFPPGVLDLTLKETAVAWQLMKPHSDPKQHHLWGQALSALRPAAVFVAEQRIRSGQSLHNYGISSVVGEWLRCQFGLAGDRDWLERVLEWELPLFTAHGMYRDPADPMLYDLMVRQNLSELIEWGYDGVHTERIRELLRRSGRVTLHMLSPCGYAPYGGRSNGLLHNEAMVSYICEHQSNELGRAGSVIDAASFRLAGATALRACLPYLQEPPLRYIKNWFPPQSRHGKDGGYGEYANYALLAASLFARTALVAGEAPLTVPASRVLLPTVLDLWPEFHKVFMNCGDLHLEIDTRAQPGYEATGLGRFHHAYAPPNLALSAGIPAAPKFVADAAVHGRAACLGPAWQTASGEWASLAGIPSSQIEHVQVIDRTGTGDASEAQVRWSICSEARSPVCAVTQTFCLDGERVRAGVALQGVCQQAGYEVPCLVTDGRETAETVTTPTSVVVRCEGWEFVVNVSQATVCILEDVLRSNRFGLYRIARFSVPGSAFEAQLTLRPIPSP